MGIQWIWCIGECWFTFCYNNFLCLKKFEKREREREKTQYFLLPRRGASLYQVHIYDDGFHHKTNFLRNYWKHWTYPKIEFIIIWGHWSLENVVAEFCRLINLCTNFLCVEQFVLCQESRQYSFKLFPGEQVVQKLGTSSLSAHLQAHSCLSSFLCVSQGTDLTCSFKSALLPQRGRKQ